MESHAKRLIQSIVLNVFFLSCFSLLRGELSYQEIRALAYTEFAPHEVNGLWRPGLANLLYKTDEHNILVDQIDRSNVQGSAFELETALYVQAHGQPIIGFDLDISFEHGKVAFEYEGKAIKIKTTEFDVVTPRFLLEVKSSSHPDGMPQPSDGSGASVAPIEPYVCACQEKQMMQFRKERLMIWWMVALKKDLDAGVLHINAGPGTHRPFITIRGHATGGRPITFTSSWICGNSEPECIAQFKYVVDCLADKIFLVLFKHAAPELVAKLKQESFIAKDNVSLDECVVSGPGGLQLASV